MAKGDPNTLQFNYLTSQEVAFFRIAAAWMLISVYTGWFVADQQTATNIVGISVNLNLIVFYASPLQTLQRVLESSDSSPIHRPTMAMNLANAFFWFLYGLARHDMVIFLPNGLGTLLGMAQLLLCVRYPTIPVFAAVGRELEPLLTIKTIVGEEQNESVMAIVV